MIGKDNRVMVKTIMKIRSWNRRDNSYPGIQRNEIRVCDSSRRKVNARRLLRRSLPFGKRKEAAKSAEVRGRFEVKKVVTGVGVLGSKGYTSPCTETLGDDDERS